MSSNLNSKSESLEESCLNIPYIEIMLPSEQMPMYLDSQTLDICHGESSKEAAKHESKSDMNSEQGVLVSPLTENVLTHKGTNCVKEGRSNLPESVDEVLPPEKGSREMKIPNNISLPEKSGQGKVFTCIHASEIKNYVPKSGEEAKQSVKSFGEETSSADSNQDHLDNFLTSSEEEVHTKLEKNQTGVYQGPFTKDQSGVYQGPFTKDQSGVYQGPFTKDQSGVYQGPFTKDQSGVYQGPFTKDQSGVYQGPFTRRLKLQMVNLESNEVSPLPNVDSISNGLIVEIYHYWMKRKYKIQCLCQWIRSLCPQPLILTDSSLYVKIKNLIKTKHKQTIRSKTQKFAGCLKVFQCSPFFNSENILHEDLSNETERERFLRVELKKAQKIIHRQEKELVKKKVIIKSISYDLEKLMEELTTLKEANKLAKKKHRSLLEDRVEAEDLVVGEEDSKDNGSDTVKRRRGDPEASRTSKKKIQTSPDEEVSKPLEIQNYFSLSGNQNGTHSDSDDAPSGDEEEKTSKRRGRRRRRRRRGLKAEIESESLLENLEEIPTRWLGFDKRVKIKIEHVPLSET